MIHRIEDEVCSSELSKKLKSLGVKQDSLWYWIKNNENKEALIFKSFFLTGDEKLGSAFTCSELGKMLPFSIELDYHVCYLGSMCGYTRFAYNANVNYHHNDGGDEIIDFDFMDVSEANARARMLIYLIEQRLIKVEDIK